MRSLAVTFAFLLLAPAGAQAATTVAISGTRLVVTGLPGTHHNVTVGTAGGNLVVADAETSIVAGAGCAMDAATAVCPAAGLTRIGITTDSGVDTVVIASSVLVGADISAGAGDDKLTGGAGNDVIHGDGGNDTLRGGGGADELWGDADVDSAVYDERVAPVTVTLGAGANDGFAGEGDDVRTENVAGGTGDDVLTGSAGDDGLYGVAGNDVLRGGDGNDQLDGGFDTPGADALYGEGGDDTLKGWAGNDRLEGGDGNDWIEGREGDDVLLGGAGNDQLRGHEDTDEVRGGDGDDFVNPGSGPMGIVDGGPGYDDSDFQEQSNGFGGVEISLDGVANDAGSYGGGGNVTAIERLALTFSGDVFTGSDAAETVLGAGGDDALHGAGGNDWLAGNGNQDLLDGGPGIDTADFWDGPTGCTVTLDGIANDGNGADNALTENVASCLRGTITGDDGPNVLTGSDFDDVLNGAGGDDVLFGGQDNDKLNGGAGRDELSGDTGNDVLHGDDGDDRLVGGAGGDGLWGDAGVDLSDYSSSGVGVTVTLGGGAADADGDDARTENVRGSSKADVLTGDGDANRLEGGSGADTLRGGEGDDVLDGGLGADVLDGQGGSDRADYSREVVPVRVTLGAGADDGAAGEGDDARVEGVSGGLGADVLTGDASANFIDGGDGDDALDGGAGDDLLTGGPGRDSITTGAGSDDVRARDGEADALACDALTGKLIAVDALDTSSTCDMSGAPSALPVVRSVPVLDAPVLDLGPPPVLVVRARDAAALAAAVDDLPRGTVRVRGAKRLRLGELACRPGLRCSASVTVKRGRSVLARGSVRVDDDVTVLSAAWTSAGHKALRGGKKVPVVVTLVLSEGATRATVRISLNLKGGAR